MNRDLKQAIKDLSDINRLYGLFCGRWENDDPDVMDDAADQYVNDMKQFADEWGVEYSTDLSDYIDVEEESECFTLMHMGDELYDMSVKAITTKIFEEVK